MKKHFHAQFFADEKQTRRYFCSIFFCLHWKSTVNSTQHAFVLITHFTVIVPYRVLCRFQVLHIV